MAYVNNYQCCGRVTKEPQIDPSGSFRIKFTIALNRPGQQRAFYIDCVGWGGIAERLAEAIQRGTEIFVSGEIETSSFQDGRGSWHKATSLRVEKYSITEGAKENIREAKLRSPHPPYAARQEPR